MCNGSVSMYNANDGFFLYLSKKYLYWLHHILFPFSLCALIHTSSVGLVVYCRLSASIGCLYLVVRWRFTVYVDIIICRVYVGEYYSYEYKNTCIAFIKPYFIIRTHSFNMPRNSNSQRFFCRSVWLCSVCSFIANSAPLPLLLFLLFFPFSSFYSGFWFTCTSFKTSSTCWMCRLAPASNC